MANAIKRISVARGYDVTGYTLQCFGGAGGQHACAVADALGMQQVLIHPLAGVLSAFGMGLADQIAMREASVERPLDDAGLQAARQRLATLTDAAVAAVQLLQPAGESEPDKTLLRVQHELFNLGSILATRDRGTIYFFSMATSFTAASLGAEGVGKDVDMLMGNLGKPVGGFPPGIVAQALGKSIPQVGTTTFRPPFVPTSIAAMGAGGRGRAVWARGQGGRDGRDGRDGRLASCEAAGSL